MSAVSKSRPKPGGRSRQSRHSIRTFENTALLWIAVLMVFLALVRYWRYVHWSLR